MSLPLQTPGERLARSRERLRVEFQRRQRRAAPAAQGTEILELLKTAMPNAGFAIDAIGLWLAQSPGVNAGGPWLDKLRPLVQRYPVAMAMGALGVGMLLARLRLWRYLPWPSLFASLLASGAVQAWMQSVSQPAAPVEAQSDPEAGA